MTSRVYELFNQNVKQELDADSELALVFYATFNAYDLDIDPFHNPEWCAGAAKTEFTALEQAKARLLAARKWLSNQS